MWAGMLLLRTLGTVGVGAVCGRPNGFLLALGLFVGGPMGFSKTGWCGLAPQIFNKLDSDHSGQISWLEFWDTVCKEVVAL